MQPGNAPRLIQEGRWDSGSWDVGGYFYLGGWPFATYIGGQAYFIHNNALGSTTMTTGPAGAVAGEMLFYSKKLVALCGGAATCWTYFGR